jgi:hypothetical protein
MSATTIGFVAVVSIPCEGERDWCLDVEWTCEVAFASKTVERVGGGWVEILCFELEGLCVTELVDDLDEDRACELWCANVVGK